jgi:hypothetical protein
MTIADATDRDYQQIVAICENVVKRAEEHWTARSRSTTDPGPAASTLHALERRQKRLYVDNTQQALRDAVTTLKKLLEDI